MNIQKAIKTAIEQFGHETIALEFLPENRYNRSIFPTTGQYDWFSGQVLYCLIRYLKPRRILEISTGSGYATIFMAMALKQNKWGKVDTFEWNATAAKAAVKLFKQYDVDAFVESYVGDARRISVATPSDYNVYFLDSLHTEDFARWFIDTHIMRSDRIDAFFHMHDILPLHSRVRRWNAPPFESDEEQRVSIHVHPPDKPGVLDTFDGNSSTEAIWGNKLAALMKPEDNVFVHDIVNDYQQMTPRKYDHAAIGRSDSKNIPMEWNEAWWCNVAALKVAYRQFNETQRDKSGENV